MSTALLPDKLPPGAEVVQRGKTIGRDLNARPSLLCREFGIGSEVEYKRKMVSEGRIMTAMNIGMQTWDDTARALEAIHRAGEERGFRIDRYQMNLDRRMGLPRQFWARAARETGPMLESAADWQAVGEVVPIEPHLGDMMIGSPASVDNACRAIEAGVNYIGNLSQFHWQYPGWPGDDVQQVTETVTALGVMAAHVRHGAMVHSYLDDGFCAQFHDYCSYIGWARFERRVVDELIGARLSVSYGGLSHHPATKAAMILALEAITPAGHMNAFYHGNTTAYSPVLDENFGVMSMDVLYMVLARERAGGGAAVLSVPVTEPVRVPTWEEIVQIQTVARRLADDAPRVAETIDWQPIEARRDALVEGGQRFYENLMQSLDEAGVDTEDPLALLLAVRRLGPRNIERRCGQSVAAAPPDDRDGCEHGGEAIPTDTFMDFIARRDATRAALGPRQHSSPSQSGPVVVVGSADVHEYALALLEDALAHLDANVVLAGTSVDPDHFARLASDHDAALVLVSTHNGMALGYAEQLLAELRFQRVRPVIAMGGVLNQDDEQASTPLDVRPGLERLGIRVCGAVTDVAALLADVSG